MASARIEPDLVRFIVDGSRSDEGLQRLLLCDFDGALGIFTQERWNSPFMAVLACYATAMKFLTTFEESDKKELLTLVKSTLLAVHTSDGHFRVQLAEAKTTNQFQHHLAIINLDILSAECLMCKALTFMLDMEVSSYVKAGWLMRKAWKIYEVTYERLQTLIDVYVPNHRELQQINDAAKVAGSSVLIDDHMLPKSPPVHPPLDDSAFTSALELDRNALEDPPSAASSGAAVSDSAAYSPSSMTKNRRFSGSHSTSHIVDSKPNGHLSGQPPKLAKLYFADKSSKAYLLQQVQSNVAFGYGLFHVCMSILSPGILKLLKFLGFKTDRVLGLRCVRMVIRCDTSRGPIASYVSL